MGRAAAVVVILWFTSVLMFVGYTVADYWQRRAERNRRKKGRG